MIDAFVVPAELRGGRLVAVTRRPETAAMFDNPPYVLKFWADILDGDRCQRIPPDGMPAYCVTPGVRYRTRQQWRDWVSFSYTRSLEMTDVLTKLSELEAGITRADFAESVRGSILDLLKLLMANWENIDATELEAIIAKLTEAGIALAAGSYIAAAVAAFAAWRLYRAAIKTPAPGPVV